MPIVRTYACPECNHMLEVTLAPEQWDVPPPDCPHCSVNLQQQFKPVAIGGSPSARAHAIAEDIAANDYHVGNMTDARKEGDVPKVRYKDQTPSQASSWQVASETLQSAISAGRQTRLKYGSGLDVLQASLKDGSQPDLIEASKKRMIKLIP